MDAAEDRMNNGRATLPDVLSARGKHRGMSSILRVSKSFGDRSPKLPPNEQPGSNEAKV
jgi:hypothetical protein